jgi:hypothetical protein
MAKLPNTGSISRNSWQAEIGPENGIFTPRAFFGEVHAGAENAVKFRIAAFSPCTLSFLFFFSSPQVFFVADSGFCRNTARTS